MIGYFVRLSTPLVRVWWNLPNHVEMSTFVSRHFRMLRSFAPISNRLPGLVEIQAAADLDRPPVVQLDFAVVHFRIQFYFKLHVQLEKALL